MGFKHPGGVEIVDFDSFQTS